MTDQPSRPGAGVCPDDHIAHNGRNHAALSRSAPKANAVSRSGTWPPDGVCPYAVTEMSKTITMPAVTYRRVRTLKWVAANPISTATPTVTAHTTHDVIRR